MLSPRREQIYSRDSTMVQRVFRGRQRTARHAEARNVRLNVYFLQTAAVKTKFPEGRVLKNVLQRPRRNTVARAAQ